MKPDNFVTCPHCLHKTLHWIDSTHVSVVCDTCKLYLNIQSPLENLEQDIKNLTPHEFKTATVNRGARRKMESKRGRKKLNEQR